MTVKCNIYEKFNSLKHKSLSIGVLIAISVLALLFITAIFAPYIAPNDPVASNMSAAKCSPCKDYPLGADHLGRCVLSRIIFGTRVSLSIGLIVVSSSLTIGLFVGTISGYLGGWVDEIIMRIVDAFLSFPSLLLALGIAGLFGAGFKNLIIALIIVDWAAYARLSRSSTIAVKEQDYIKASRGLGTRDIHVILRHIVPNIMSPLIVMATVGMGYAILSAAGLSFLGFGVQPPTPEWGSMLDDGKIFIRSAPHIMIFPGMAISLTVLAFNYIGDALRDIFDPRTQNKME